MASSKQRSSKSIPETIIHDVQDPSGEHRSNSLVRSNSRDTKSEQSFTGVELNYSNRGSEKLSCPSSHPTSDSKSKTSHLGDDDKTSNSLGRGGGIWSKRINDYFNVSQWLQRFHHRHETLGLTSEDDQRDFFCLVMSVKCAQLLIILIAILIPMYFRTIHDFVYQNHNYWVCLPFACAFVTGTVVRVFPIFQTLQRRFHALLLGFITICYAYSMGSLSVAYDSLIVEKVFLLLTTTLIFKILFVFTVKISVVKKMLYISATSSVIFFATTMALLPPVFQSDPSFELSIDVWLPAVIATEILIYLLIFEMQSVLAGDRVVVTKKDWLYLALYL